MIVLALQIPKQLLPVLQTPSVQSSSHLPFLHSLAGNKYIVISGDPLEPLLALKLLFPLRFLFLGSIKTGLVLLLHALSPRSEEPSLPCHPTGLPASAGLEVPEFHLQTTSCSLTPTDHIETGLRGASLIALSNP